jgi:hypothetical protein
MKIQFMSRLCIGLLFIILGNHSFAQQRESQTLSAVTVVTSNIKPIVVKTFERSFKNAVNPVWYKVNGKFLVKFVNEERSHHALYSKNGSLIYNITFGCEKCLPSQVKKVVAQNYFDYNIVSATNIQDNNRNVWEIKLEDKSKLVSIFVENEQVEEVSSYEKAI